MEWDNRISEKDFEKGCKDFNRILIEAVEKFLDGYKGKKVYQVASDVVPVVLIRMLSLHFIEHFEQSNDSVKTYVGFIERQILDTMEKCNDHHSSCEVEYLDDQGATA